MRHRRRILLINPKFQLKFSFFVCSWILVLTFAFPSIAISAADALVRLVEKKIDPATLQILENFKAELFTGLFLFMAVYGVAIFLMSLFLSQRIAGPVYRVQVALERMSRGNIEDNVLFRKSDHFGELADAFNQAASQIARQRNQNHEAIASLQKIAVELEDRHTAQIQEIIGELQWKTARK